MLSLQVFCLPRGGACKAPGGAARERKGLLSLPPRPLAVAGSHTCGNLESLFVVLRGSALELLSPGLSFLPPSSFGSSESTSCPVGGPTWTPGHKGPPGCSLHTCSQSEQRHRAGGGGSARLALLSSPHGPPQSPATAIRQRRLPALQWVPASVVSGSTHSHVDSWPDFLVGAELSGEQRSLFCFLVGRSALAQARELVERGNYCMGVRRLTRSGLGIEFETQRCQETPGFSPYVPGYRWEDSMVREH